MATAIAFPPPPQELLAANGWPEIEEVPCALSADLSVRGFTVRDLLLLRPGALVNSRQPTSGRIAVRANGSFIAWAEFEVVEDHLGLRLTDLG